MRPHGEGANGRDFGGEGGIRTALKTGNLLILQVVELAVFAGLTASRYKIEDRPRFRVGGTIPFMPCSQCGKPYDSDVNWPNCDYSMCAECEERRKRAWERHEKGGGSKGHFPYIFWWALAIAGGLISPVICLPIVAILWFIFGRDTRPRPPRPYSDDDFLNYDDPR